jgi:glycosyltransferase involved in cell wall biosynthesis
MLAGLGKEVHVVVFHSKRRKGADRQVGKKGFVTTREENFIVHRFQSVPRTRSGAAQDFMSDVYGELRRLHDREDFDVFHGFYINETGFLTTLLAREVDRPVINSIRGADLHRNVFNPQQYGQIQWALENSDWLTFVSRELERRAHVLAPSVRNRTTAFWNSIVPFDYAQIPRPVPGPALRGTVISSFGNMRDKKGIDYLIEACAELAQEVELTLLLVGDFIPKEKDHWAMVVRDSGIEDRIVITGRLPREEALGYHHVSDIFAIPSLRDGCPNALAEAMLAEKAIVGSSADAIGEILEHEDNALVVRPGDTQDLVNALRRLAMDPPLRHRLGQSARAKALRDLAPAREQEDWLMVYNRVVAASAPSVVSMRTASRV